MDHRFLLGVFFNLGVTVISTLNSLRHGQEMQVKMDVMATLWIINMREL